MSNTSTPVQVRWPPVLMYHAITQVTDDPKHVCVTPKRFETHMLYLKRLNLRGVSVKELFDAANAGNAKGLIGLTFDDGYANFLHTAVPVLEKLGFSATVFVVANKLGEESDWMTPRLKLLSKDQVCEVAERGMEVGSHGMAHIKLSNHLGPEVLNHEIVGSGKYLSKVLGEAIKGFCYPYGTVDEMVAQAVQQAGYTYACGVSTIGGIRGGNVYNTPRLYVGNRDGTLRFPAKLHAYSQYSRMARKRAIRLIHPLIRRYGLRYWIGWPTKGGNQD
jgi:peptidoglycan/xylan/chitin deacetylase (PgdA/CDA1 family)